MAAAAVHNREMANSALRFGDECLAEWGLGKTVIDLHSGAAVFHFTGRRGLKCHAKIVQPSRSGQTGVERGVENIVAISQKLFHVLESEALQEILRRDAGPG